MGKRWMAACEIDPPQMNRKDMTPFVVSFICAVIVAGMTRHFLNMNNVHTFDASALVELGLGYSSLCHG
jgi:hypothetical protein